MPHWEAAKPIKRTLPTVPESGPEPTQELTAVDFLARQHKVRPAQIRTVAGLLDGQPAPPGQAAAEAIGRGERYGRRVLAAAKELTEARA